MRATALFALLLVTACAGSSQSASGLPRIAPGHASFEGKPGGYYIWADSDGWHLRTSGGSQMLDLQGVISAIDGKIEDLRPLASNDRSSSVVLTEQGIVFSLPTQQQSEGFDWKVTSGCNRFDLQARGQRTASVIRLGAAAEAPMQVPFDLCK